jgi:hypothetical protein
MKIRLLRLLAFGVIAFLLPMHARAAEPGYTESGALDPIIFRIKYLEWVPDVLDTVDLSADTKRKALHVIHQTRQKLIKLYAAKGPTQKKRPQLNATWKKMVRDVDKLLTPEQRVQFRKARVAAEAAERAKYH